MEQETTQATPATPRLMLESCREVLNSCDCATTPTSTTSARIPLLQDFPSNDVTLRFARDPPHNQTNAND